MCLQEKRGSKHQKVYIKPIYSARNTYIKGIFTIEKMGLLEN